MSKYLFENLFGIDGWNIAWYGVIIAVGMVLGVMLAIYRARKQGLKEELIFDFILLALQMIDSIPKTRYNITTAEILKQPQIGMTAQGDFP